MLQCSCGYPFRSLVLMTHRQLYVCNSAQVSLCVEEILFLRPVKTGRVNRAGEIGYEHAITRNIQGNTDSLHQMVEDDLRLLGFRIDGCAINSVAAWWVADIGLIFCPSLHVQL